MASSHSEALLIFYGGCFVIVLLVLKFLHDHQFASTETEDNFWSTIPKAGVPRRGLLPWTCAGLASITNSERHSTWGYLNYCKKLNSPFALPSAGSGAIVVLPPSMLSNVLSRPVTEVEAWRAQLDNIQPKYMIPGQGQGIFTEDDRHPIQFTVVRRHMTRPEDVGAFAPIIAKELSSACADYWACGEVGHSLTINLWRSCSQIVARVANRIFIGLPLCRNETLLEQSRLYADAMYGGAALISAVPGCMRPVIGPLVALPARRYLAGCKKILVPYVQERLDTWNGGKGEGAPNDALQWMIEECARAGSHNLEPAGIAQRILLLNLVSIYTTTYALANCLLDLFSSPSRHDFVSGLRAECHTVSVAHGGSLDTKEAIDELYRCDSTVRESLRVSAFGVVGLPRIVTPGGGGLKMDGGHFVPEGVRLGVPLRAIHHDPEYYTEPELFDAFRFSRSFEGPDGSCRQRTEQKLSVSTSETFLTYGHGKQACPGRWFASQIIKQALAHIVQTYEVQVISDSRAKNVVLNMIMPPTTANLRVALRQDRV